MVYSDSAFLRELMPDLDKINTSVLLNYYNNNVLNNEFIHVLKNGDVLHLKAGKDNFFHLTGLQHSDAIIRTMYEKITLQPSGNLNYVQLSAAVKGTVAYNHFVDNVYDLSENIVSKAMLSRVSRFNQIHNILKAPQFIVEVDSKTASSHHALKQGDLLFSIESKSKILSVVVSQDASTNHWYLKSYFADRPQYCDYMHLFTPSNNLKLANISIARNDVVGYINSVYGSMNYPFLNKLGGVVSENIKRINEMSNRLLKFETIRTQYVELQCQFSDFQSRGIQPSDSDHKRYRLLENIVKGLDSAESLYMREVTIENQHTTKAPLIENEIDI